MSGPPNSPAKPDRLDSWKEIAAYLGREVRTVQLWEKSEDLPVHRHQHSRQGSVYAFRSELDAWRESRKPAADQPAVATVAPAAGAAGRQRAGVWLALACVLALAALAWILWRRRPPPATETTASSVAVLPFLDLSPQKDQEYFSDGLTEEIIDALSRVPNLHVVSRTSTFAFKGRAVDIREIGRQLNVDTVLEGSVRKAGDEIRITAQLNRVSDGYHLWSQTYDRRLSDVFAVQREISQSIADQLRAGRVPHRQPTGDMEAYRLYQEGRFFFNQFTFESEPKAIERYQQAIARDPKFALAYSGLADAYAYMAETFVAPPREVMPKAKAAAEQAVELDPNLGEAHTSLGIVKMDYERDWQGAQREFRRAMELNPGSGYAHHWYAHSLEAQGRLDDAMREMRVALQLDPLSIPINWDIGNELLCARRYPEALRHLQHADELFPKVPVIQYLLADAYDLSGDLRSGTRLVEELKKDPELRKDPLFLGLIGIQAFREGRREDARQILKQLDTLHQARYVEPITALQLCAVLQDNKALLLWLKRADEERSTLFVYLPMMKDCFQLDAGVVAQVLQQQH